MKKPLHDTTNDRSIFSCSDSQCYVTALGFKTILPYASRKRQHTFGSGQPCPLADIPFFHLCSLFNFQSSNSLMGILKYHNGCTHVKILGKLFSIPRGRKFYSPILKISFRKFKNCLLSSGRFCAIHAICIILPTGKNRSLLP